MKMNTVRLVMAGDLNSYGTLFGGKLMCWMDELAAILAMKLTCRECVTVKFENIHFKNSVKIGDMLELEAELKDRGNTSLKIDINVYKSSSNNGRILTGSGTAIFVALDDKKQPTNIWKTTCHN